MLQAQVRLFHAYVAAGFAKPASLHSTHAGRPLLCIVFSSSVCKHCDDGQVSTAVLSGDLVWHPTSSGPKLRLNIS